MQHTWTWWVITVRSAAFFDHIWSQSSFSTYVSTLFWSYIRCFITWYCAWFPWRFGSPGNEADAKGYCNLHVKTELKTSFSWILFYRFWLTRSWSLSEIDDHLKKINIQLCDGDHFIVSILIYNSMVSFNLPLWAPIQVLPKYVHSNKIIYVTVIMAKNYNTLEPSLLWSYCWGETFTGFILACACSNYIHAFSTNSWRKRSQFLWK